MTLSELIKNYRKRYALSQQDFAYKIGITMCMVNHIENYHKHAGNRVMRAVAEELELPITEVVEANERQKLKMVHYE